MRRFISSLWRNDGTRNIAPQVNGNPSRAAGATSDPSEPGELPDPTLLETNSDYRPFLREGVSIDLRRLALRRAWTSDPAIAAFKGFADYDWDANAVGYGWLRPADAALAAATVLGQAERRPEEKGAVVAELETLDEADADVRDNAPPDVSAAQTKNETSKA